MRVVAGRLIESALKAPVKVVERVTMQPATDRTQKQASRAPPLSAVRSRMKRRSRGFGPTLLWVVLWMAIGGTLALALGPLYPEELMERVAQLQKWVLEVKAGIE